MKKKKRNFKEILSNCLQEYAFAGIDKESYEKNKVLINERNIEMIKQSSKFLALLLFSLLVVAFFSESLAAFWIINLVYFVLCSLLYFITKKIKKLTGTACTVFSYIFILAIESFAAILAIKYDPGYSFIALFLIAQIILPAIILDKPYRLVIFLVITTAIFDFCLIKLNPSIYLEFTIYETIVCCLIGIYVNFKVIQNKFYDAMKIRGVELERDTDSLIEIDSRSKLFRDLENIELDQVTGIMMMDIDNFKSYNDDYGHQMGDSCLKKVGKMLKEFDEKFKLNSARYGGEEFVVYSTFHTPEEFEAISINLVKKIYDLNIEFEKSKDQRVTISIGFTTPKDKPESIKQYISFADTALYLAKALGKNRAAAYRKS